RVSLGSEMEAMAALQLLDVGDDSHPLGPLELLELLHDLAESAQVPLELGAIADRSGVESARCANRWVPRSEAAAIDDRIEHGLDGRRDQLGPSNDGQRQLAVFAGRRRRPPVAWRLLGGLHRLSLNHSSWGGVGWSIDHRK